MKAGPLRCPEGVTMKKMRSDNSRGNITRGCSSVTQLELGDGGAVVVGVMNVRGISRVESKLATDRLGETPEDRRRLSSFPDREA